MKAVVITLGVEGADVLQAGKPKIRQDSFKVNIVDARGAGDAFSVTLAWAVAEKKSLEEAGQAGRGRRGPGHDPPGGPGGVRHPGGGGEAGGPGSCFPGVKPRVGVRPVSENGARGTPLAIGQRELTGK